MEPIAGPLADVRILLSQRSVSRILPQLRILSEALFVYVNQRRIPIHKQHALQLVRAKRVLDVCHVHAPLAPERPQVNHAQGRREAFRKCQRLRRCSRALHFVQETSLNMCRVRCAALLSNRSKRVGRWIPHRSGSHARCRVLRRQWLRRLLRHAQSSYGAQHRQKKYAPNHFALVQKEPLRRITLRATPSISEARFSAAPCLAALLRAYQPLRTVKKNGAGCSPAPRDSRS